MVGPGSEEQIEGVKCNACRLNDTVHPVWVCSNCGSHEEGNLPELRVVSTPDHGEGLSEAERAYFVANLRQNLGYAINPIIAATLCRRVEDILAARAADRDAGLREEVARLRGWLREATEAEWSEPCRLDHHGGCQNHGYLDGPCLIPTVRDYFAALDPPTGNPTGSDLGGTDE